MKRSSRRSFIATAVAALTGSTVFGNNTKSCSCEVKAQATTTDEQEPDFNLSGLDRNDNRIEVPVYWKTKEDFSTVGSGYTGSVALAFSGQHEKKIWLNKNYKPFVGLDVIAHEFGHIIGYGHIDGTIMGAGILEMGDKNEESELTEVTRDVVSRLDGAEIMSWGENDPQIDQLQEVIISWAMNRAEVGSVVIASNRYSGYLDEYDSVWFSTSWDNLGGVASRSPKFYCET